MTRVLQVTDMASMKAMMRYNNWRKDPVRNAQRCRAPPMHEPYSPYLLVCCLSDVNVCWCHVS